jgi:hypothetical protein
MMPDAGVNYRLTPCRAEFTWIAALHSVALAMTGRIRDRILSVCHREEHRDVAIYGFRPRALRMTHDGWPG